MKDPDLLTRPDLGGADHGEDTDANIPAESRWSWRDQERRRLADMRAGTIDGYVVEDGADGDVERRTVNRGDKDFPKTRQRKIRLGNHRIKQMTGTIAEMRRQIANWKPFPLRKAA